MSNDPLDYLPLGPPPPRSKASQLLELLPQIESAVRAGHSHFVIHEYIVKSRGLDLTFRYYELTLGRLRKRLGIAAPHSRTAPTMVQPAPNTIGPTNESKKTLPVIGGATSKVQKILFESVDDFFK
jgi:hypothetical protein